MFIALTIVLESRSQAVTLQCVCGHCATEWTERDLASKPDRKFELTCCKRSAAACPSTSQQLTRLVSEASKAVEGAGRDDERRFWVYKRAANIGGFSLFSCLLLTCPLTDTLSTLDSLVVVTDTGRRPLYCCVYARIRAEFPGNTSTRTGFVAKRARGASRAGN